MGNPDESLSDFVERMMAEVLHSPEELAAKELKRLYDAYLGAGFEEWQAFELLRDSIRIMGQNR